MVLYDYLIKRYGENEPILLSDLQIEGITDVNIRQQMKKLSDIGKVKRFDTGIYFIPSIKNMTHTELTLSIEQVIEQKYLLDGKQRCGYISGLLFAKEIEGLTAKTTSMYEVVTNKATKYFRETSLANVRVIIRKPRAPVTESNYKILQFLDLLKDIDLYAEIEDRALKDCIIKYMKETGLEFSMLEYYFSYYPDKIYKNMYKAGLLHEISGL